MFRSSKLNEEKSGIMQANSPLPDLNNNNGNDSISRYLPPIINLNTDMRPHQVKTSFEFVNAPTMRHIYKKKVDDKTQQVKKSASYQMLDLKANKNSPRKENMRLKFLSERPARDYVAKNENNEVESTLLDYTETEDEISKDTNSFSNENTVNNSAVTRSEKQSGVKCKFKKKLFYVPLTPACKRMFFSCIYFACIWSTGIKKRMRL